MKCKIVRFLSIALFTIVVLIFVIGLFYKFINMYSCLYRINYIYILALLLIFIYYLCRETKPSTYKISNGYSKSYDSIIQLVIHSDNLNWQRLYYFLVFNSILIAAGTNIYSGIDFGCTEFIDKKIYPLIFMSVVGFAVSMLWIPISLRGIKYQNFYMAWARNIERKNASDISSVFVSQTKLTKNGTVQFPDEDDLDEEYYKIKHGLIAGNTLGARCILYIIPIILAVLYSLLLVYFVETLQAISNCGI